MERRWSARRARFSAPPCASLPISTEHDPEKHALGLRPDGWAPVFPSRQTRNAFARRSCSNNKVERDDEIIALWLLRRLLQRRDTRQQDLDSGTAARLGIEVEPAAEAIGHDAVDDMQAEPGAALIPARGEKRIESASAHIEAHAAAIVGEDDFEIILAR